MVEEWCGGSGGRLVPLCIVPLWDPQLAAAEVERNAARGVRAVCFSEIPRVPRAAEHPQRRLGSVLRRVRGDRHRAVPAHRLGHEDAVDLGRRAARRHGHDRLRQLHELARRLRLRIRPCSSSSRSMLMTPHSRRTGSRLITCSSEKTWMIGSSSENGGFGRWGHPAHGRPFNDFDKVREGFRTHFFIIWLSPRLLGNCKAKCGGRKQSRTLALCASSRSLGW